MEEQKHLPRNPLGINQHPRNRGKTIGFRFRNDQEKMLREYAKKHDMTLTSVVEQAIDFFFKIENLEKIG
jgi:hypothetical protein